MRSDIVLFSSRVLDTEGITFADLKILVAVGRCARYWPTTDPLYGWGWPSFALLEELTGLSRPTIADGIRRLREGGFLRVLPSRYRDGRTGPNHYYVVLDATRAHDASENPFVLTDDGVVLFSEEGGSKADFTGTKMGVKRGGGGGVKSSSLSETAQVPSEPRTYSAPEASGDFTGTHTLEQEATTTTPYVIECVRAANTGYRENPAYGSAFNEMIASAQDVHHEWITEGIPVETAVATILDRARKLKLKRPPTSLAYYAAAVREAHERAQHRAGGSTGLTEAERLVLELTGGKP